MLKLDPSNTAIVVASNVINELNKVLISVENALNNGVPEAGVTGEQLKTALGNTLEQVEKILQISKT